jgi:hypothetical protein
MAGVAGVAFRRRRVALAWPTLSAPASIIARAARRMVRRLRGVAAATRRVPTRALVFPTLRPLVIVAFLSSRRLVVSSSRLLFVSFFVGTAPDSAHLVDQS